MTLWSRLPVELVQQIIQHTSDRETLLAWCRATTDSYDLHQAANREYWYELYVHHTDLIASDEELRGFETRHEGANRQDFEYTGREYYWELHGSQLPADPEARAAELKHEFAVEERCQERYRLNSTSRTGIIHDAATVDPHDNVSPLIYIKQLVMDFQLMFLKGWSFKNYTEILGCLPTGETLENSLDMLFPSLYNLRTIKVAGILPQEVLDRITSAHLTNINTLMLRFTDSRGHFRTSGSRGRCQFLDLDWQHLDHLPQLQTLELYHLKRAEADSLARVIGRLKLTKLLIGANDPSSTLTHSGSRDVVSPLTRFFDYVFPSEPRTKGQPPEGRGDTGLPVTLKSFTVLDNGFRGGRYSYEPAFIDVVQSGIQSSCPKIEYAYISIHRLSAAMNLLDWLAAPNLTHLAIVFKPQTFWDITSTERPSEIRPSEAHTEDIEKLDKIIATHPNLKELKLLNVLDHQKAPYYRFDELSRPGFRMEDRVIYTKPYHEAMIRRPSDMLRFYKLLPWSKELQRLYVQQYTGQESAYFDAITTTCINLRILVISGDRHLKSDTEALERLAKSYAEKLPNLVLIILEGTSFWFQRQRAENTHLILWHLPRAKADDIQSLEIRKRVFKRDWEFTQDPFLMVRKTCMKLKDINNSIDTNFVVMRKRA